MGPAAAFEAREAVADLLLRRVRGVAQQRRCGHDPAIEAIAALRHLLGDEGGLQRVRLVQSAKPGEGRDLVPAAADTGKEQDRVGAPSTWTVQAPHCASPQPKCGLLSPSSLRST